MISIKAILNNIFYESWHDQLFAKASSYLKVLEGSSILLTGMTGFFGSAVLDMLIRYMRVCKNPATIYILTRDSKAFYNSNPKLIDCIFIRVVEGDIRNFEITAAKVDYIIHGASTSNVEKFTGKSSLYRFENIVFGAHHLLQIAKNLSTKKILFISSGAVYGGASGYTGPISESCNNGPNLYSDPESCYSEGKRAAELLHILYSKTYGIEITVARCFSFCGPNIPLDINYAIGNFIRDVLKGNPISMRSDGAAVRSYMYTYDLAVWLFALLVKGKNCEVYNVGSEEYTTMKGLAERIKTVAGSSVPVNTKGTSVSIGNNLTAAGDWYVPDVNKAMTDLGLDVWTNLEMTIRLTIEQTRISNE